MSAAIFFDPRTRARLAASRSAKLGAAIVLVMVAFALFLPLFSPYQSDVSDFVHGTGAGDAPIGPCRLHWLGTDRIFRDQLTRLATGARLSLEIGVGASLLSTLLGALVGMTAGLFEGTAIDAVLMRIVDIGLSFPFLLLIMAIGAAIDRTTPLTILFILGVTGWLGTARLVRAKTLQVRAQEYVTAARALGAGFPAILRRHVLPNVAGTLIFTATLSVAQMLLAESWLDYLGVGVAPPTASWGRMLLEAQDYYLAAPWLAIAPALAVVIAALGFHLLGEGLRDAIDPRTR